MSIEHLTTESVLKLYENIRTQVVADTLTGSPHRLLRDAARQESNRLGAELDRRGVKFLPINWPTPSFESATAQVHDDASSR